jgi:copper transport protein
MDAARVAALAAVLMLGLAPGAGAHAYLVRSAPAVGASAAHPPRRVVLDFSEPVAPLAGTDVIGPRGASALRGKPYVPGGRSSTIVLPLDSRIRRGRYVVRWREVDANDGHRLSGSFEFAVGRQGAPPASGVRTSGGFSPQMAAARWLLILSVLLAGGYVLFRRLVLLRSLPGAAGLRPRELETSSAALAVTLAGAALAAAVLIALASGPLSTGYARRMLAGGAIAAAGAAAALAARRRPGALPLAEVAAVTILALPSATGHAVGGTQREAFSIPGDVAHVLAAAIWIGGLAALAVVAPVVLRTVDAPTRRGALAAMARRFTPLALCAVALLGATGLVRAVGELGAVSQLWATGYGRALIAKTALLAVALGLAWLSRHRVSGGSIKWAVRPELGVLVVLIGVVAVLTDLSPGRSPAAQAAGAAPARGSPLVVAGRAGDLAVGVSIAPMDGRSARARATVIGAEGPRGGLIVSFRVAGRTQRASGCGSGCYQAAVRLASDRPQLAVVVRVPGRGRQIAQLPMPVTWPAPPATAILRRAESAWRRLRSLSAVSRIASDARHSVTTAWRFRAPNRLAYRNLPGGSEAVVIGGRRWDRASPAASWQESAQDAVRQPVPPWSGATAFAHLLGTETIDLRKVLRISFLDRSAPAWFTILVDAATYRTTRVDMVAQAHFMHQANRAFDRAARISAPRG